MDFPNSADSATFQDSPIFSYISNLSPIKPLKAAPVAQGFPGLSSPPLVFSTPRIHSEHSLNSLTRPPFCQLSCDELPLRDDDSDNIDGMSIYESGNLDTKLGSELNFCTDKGTDNKSTPEDVCSYLADPLEVDCGNSVPLANSRLKHGDGTPLSPKESVAHDKDVNKAVDASPDILEQEKENCVAKFFSAPKVVEKDEKEMSRSADISIALSVDLGSEEQRKEHSNTKASQSLLSMRRRCLQFEEVHQNFVTNSTGPWNQLNAASRPPTSPMVAEVLQPSYVNMPADSSSMQLVNIEKSVCSIFPAQSCGDSSLSVSKPSGVGLYLNSIVSAAMRMDCGASISIKSAEECYLSEQGKKSVCIKSYHLTENTRSSSSSFNGFQNFPLTIEEIKHNNNIHASMMESFSNPSSNSLNPLYGSALLPMQTDDHATPCDKRKSASEYAEGMEGVAQVNPAKKRKKLSRSTDGDGCKHCNCKKTKCLKLYCDCFAAGIYCAEPCSCQGCFNRPDYEDTVNETRQLIESRNPLAFAPKIVQRVTEPLANCTRVREDISQSTPSSVRHKRGCNCKKSMCLKKYCECYQSNVGCSNGCRCEGCKNVYGKKEEYDFSKDNVSFEVITEGSDTTFAEKQELLSSRNGFLKTQLRTHHLIPLTPFIQSSDRGKDASKFVATSMRFLPSTEYGISSALHGRPLGSPRSFDNHAINEETCTEVLDAASYGNSKTVDDFSTQGIGNINPFGIQQNPPFLSTCSVTPTPGVWRNGSSAQLGTGSSPISSANSHQWRGSSTTPMGLFDETKLPHIIDSREGLYNIIRDDNTPEILKEDPTTAGVKVSSPNKKRVCPPHTTLHELGSISSAGNGSGCKYILKAAPFPLLTACIDVKDTARSTTDRD